MATAGLDRMMLWTDLEGRTLHGRWRLGRLVRPEGRTAWFEATDVDGKPVMVSITEALNDEDELLERFHAAAEIRSPHVVTLRESRISQIDDTPVVVAAMDLTEENLGDVLRERSLNATETRQVLDAVLAGLAAIHARGLVHGRMEPGSVLAMGETILLRSDCVHPGGADFAPGAAEDVRGAGKIVTQAMTRRMPANENDPVLQLLPEPMARAVRRALSGNATASEVAALVGTRLAVMTEAPGETGRKARREAQHETRPPAARIDPYSKTGTKPPAMPEVMVPNGTVGQVGAQPRTAAMSRAGAERSNAARVVAMRAPGERAEPDNEPAAATGTMGGPATLPNPREMQREIPWESPLVLEDEVEEKRRRPSAPYVIAAAAAVVLVTIFTLYGILHRAPVAPKPAAIATHAVPPPGPKVVVNPGPAANLQSEAGAGWRVVAYTYNFESAAQHKASELDQKHPELHAAVFQPRSGSPYLVTLGGAMSRTEAIGLRAKALEMGFPRDTYARNYH
ncbi:MAG: hypothetical protein WB974_01760 [Acidobacteriaceae bacterium]